ncbi:hypothetical protein BG011_000432 [Mortierella polycephala]|uniref:Uncharacterized protein n=1 Tax=Mortierella polycephala TaxID=41804 RepID=A0A9P6Q752_9FUNG|nr:hypothetical protein BG011_000432 [Mortierella polycephala]
MARLSFLTALSMITVSQLVFGTPMDPFAYGGGPGYAVGSGYGDAGYQPAMEVPVAPVSIAPQTDFIPVSNVLPVINVYPPELNDYTDYYGYPPFGYPPYDRPIPLGGPLDGPFGPLGGPFGPLGGPFGNPMGGPLSGPMVGPGFAPGVIPPSF